MAEPQQASSETNQPALPVNAAQTADPNYARQIRQLVVPPIVGALIGSVMYMIIAIQQSAWQLAMGMVGLAIAVALAVLAYRLAKRGHETAVGWLLMGAVGIAYGSPELFWSGVTLYLMVGGVVLIILAATVAVRRARTIRTTVAIIVFLVFLALANVLQPFPRYDVQHTTMLYAFVVIVTVALTLAILVQLLRSFRVGTLRTKLIIAFLAVALVPLGLQAGRNYLLDQQISIQNANQRLLAGATQLAATIDNFIYSNLDAISNEARFPTFASYLSLPVGNDGRPVDAAQQAGIDDLLANLKDKQIRALSILERPQLYILAYSLAQRDGQIVASTGPDVGQSIADQVYFREVLDTGTAYASPILFTPETPIGSLYFSAPIKDVNGNVAGVLVARYNGALLQQLVAASVGDTADESFAMLLDDNHLRLAHSSASGFLYTTVVPLEETRVAELQTAGQLPFKPIEELSTNLEEFEEALSADSAEPYFTAELGESRDELEATDDPDQAAIAKLKSQSWSVVFAQPQTIFLSPITATLRLSLIIALVIAVLVLAAAIGMARLLARPIVDLTKVAQLVATGDLSAQASVADDEVGQLGRSFNSMTEQLRVVIGSLEDRVAARTEQLRASADVGRAAATNLQTGELLSEIVNLIVDRFGLYYAAVFMLDETGQTAVLREATGDAGRTLKEQQHQLAVGGQSMVGQAVADRQARIALDIGSEAVRFANPLLPDTRSEIALPLIVGDRVLGALDVQSTQAAAFDEASAAVLQSMADQVAVALSNAEQFAETSGALRKAEILSEAILTLVGANNIQEIVHYLARYANQLVFANRTAVYIVDHDLKHITTQATIGGVVDQDELTYGLLNSGISGLVFRSGQPVLSLSADDGIEPTETAERRRQNGTGALIVVPLVAQGQVIGTVTISNLSGQRLFNQHDVDLLMTLAAQAVSVMEKLRLFEQAQRALSDLDAVNRRLTGEAWAEYTQRHDSGNIRWVSTSDRAQTTALPEVAEAISGGQIATRTLEGSGQLGVAVPIKLRDVSVGALHLVVAQQTWNDDMRTALQSIAGHVAQAAETARLLEQTERDAQRERAISGAADKIHRAMSMDRVLQTAIAEINRITGLAGVSIQLGFGESATAEGNGHGATN